MSRARSAGERTNSVDRAVPRVCLFAHHCSVRPASARLSVPWRHDDLFDRATFHLSAKRHGIDAWQRSKVLEGRPLAQASTIRTKAESVYCNEGSPMSAGALSSSAFSKAIARSTPISPQRLPQRAFRSRSVRHAPRAAARSYVSAASKPAAYTYGQARA